MSEGMSRPERLRNPWREFGKIRDLNSKISDCTPACGSGRSFPLAANEGCRFERSVLILPVVEASSGQSHENRFWDGC